jgi:glucose/arabinose dehydrogenase
MRKARLMVAAIAVLAGIAVAAGAPSTAQGSNLSLHEIGLFDYPVGIVSAPGARHLLFVVEKPGHISVVRSGQELSTPFLDIQAQVMATGGEQGLLSLAFDPGYAHNRRFYIDYVNTQGNVEVDQFRRSENSPAVALPDSQRAVIVINHPQGESHYGGQLEFHHGDLYIGVGDGGTGDDPENAAQRKGSLLGKILRIDPLPDGGYRVPATNPFVHERGRNAIFALGLRNPWRFSFDDTTGDLWIGDVGWSTWEEIDHVPLAKARGANFGWNLFEGAFPCAPCGNAGALPPPHYMPPVHTYPHHSATGGEEGDVIVGGYVVHDRRLSSLSGRYIYTDNEDGDLRAFNPRTRKSRELGLDVTSPTSFGEAQGDSIYVASLQSPGPVYRIKEGP